MDVRTYKNITAEGFAKMRTLLEAEGLAMGPGNHGLIRNAKLGIDVSFAYNEVLRELTLKIERKPFLVPSSMIWKEVENGLQKHGMQ